MKKFDPNNKAGMQCDVSGIPGYKDGAFGHTIMHVDVYKETVSCGGFIDWDGFGDQLGPKFGMLGSTRPSAVSDLNPKCVWVVWYNR